MRDEEQHLRLELQRLLTVHGTEEAALRLLRERFEETRQVIEQREGQLKELRSQAARVRDEFAACQLTSREVDLEREHLRQNFLERYRLDLDDAQQTGGLLDVAFDPTAAGARREALQRKIDEIGDVNLTATDEYRDMEERHAFLATQQDDLQRSLDGLHLSN